MVKFFVLHGESPLRRILPNPRYSRMDPEMAARRIQIRVPNQEVAICTCSRNGRFLQRPKKLGLADELMKQFGCTPVCLPLPNALIVSRPLHRISKWLRLLETISYAWQDRFAKTNKRLALLLLPDAAHEEKTKSVWLWHDLPRSPWSSSSIRLSLPA